MLSHIPLRYIHRARPGAAPMLLPILSWILAIFVAASACRAGGEKVTVWQKDGTTASGELLWIDNEGIVLSAIEDAPEEMLRNAPDAVLVIPTARVDMLTTESHSYILAGVGCGLLAGIVAGAIAGSSTETPEVPIFGAYVEAASTATSAAMGGGIGALAGLLVGAACSSSENTYTVSSPGDIAQVRAIGRYKAARPEFLPKGGS